MHCYDNSFKILHVRYNIVAWVDRRGVLHACYSGNNVELVDVNSYIPMSNHEGRSSMDKSVSLLGADH